jgi:type IV pilus assembly protein PilC
MDLASAMSAHSHVFDRLTCTRIQAANKGGYLAKALDSLAEDAELKNEINRKVSGALIYPAIVLFIALIVILVFGYIVMPQFIPLYHGRHLPFPTRVMLVVSGFLKSYPWAMIFVLGAPIYLFYKKTEIAASHLMQSFLLRAPLVKGLTRSIYLAKFMRMMAQLQQAAISIPVQLTLLREASSAAIFKDAWSQVRHDVERGASFTGAMEKHKKLFTPFVWGNLQAGEKAGKVDEAALYVAVQLESEIRDQIKNINAIIEPVIIIVLGSIIGFILFAMFLPIFDMATAV